MGLTVSQPALVIALIGILSALAAAAGGHTDAEWHDATAFDVEGRGWLDTEAAYDRLPARAHGLAPEDVWNLSKDSAGLCARFETDAHTIAIRWTLLSDHLAMPHMPATGVSGVDLYRRGANGSWRFVQNGRPLQPGENNASLEADNPTGAMQEYLLYLPLYNGVRRVEIGIPAGSHIRKAAPRPDPQRRPIVFYGTSIVQGGCASRPGMAHVAILGRMLDWPVINLGFSGSGKMEPVMATLLAELDSAVYVIDCLANMGDLRESEVAARVTTLARTIRRVHPTTPILFVAKSHVHTNRRPAISGYQEKAVQALISEGVGDLYLMNGDALLGTDEEGTVDGVHPNDVGMMRHAEATFPVLRDILHRLSPGATGGK